MNNKGTDQAARMRRLVCACVVRKPPKTGFLASRPILWLRPGHATKEVKTYSWEGLSKFWAGTTSRGEEAACRSSLINTARWRRLWYMNCSLTFTMVSNRKSRVQWLLHLKLGASLLYYKHKHYRSPMFQRVLPTCGWPWSEHNKTWEVPPESGR